MRSKVAAPRRDSVMSASYCWSILDGSTFVLQEHDGCRGGASPTEQCPVAGLARRVLQRLVSQSARSIRFDALPKTGGASYCLHSGENNPCVGSALDGKFRMQAAAAIEP